MRYALLMLFLFCLGCIPSPNKPLGRSAADAPPNPAADSAQDAAGVTEATPRETVESEPFSFAQDAATDRAAPGTASAETEPAFSLLEPAGATPAEDGTSEPAEVSLPPAAPPANDELLERPRDLLADRPNQTTDAEFPLALAPPGTNEALPPISSLPIDSPVANDRVDGDEVPVTNAPPTALIPRRLLFGNPDRARPRISPDGKQLAFLAPRDGVMNIWLAPIDDVAQAAPLTKDTHRGIRNFFWAYTNQHIVFTQDNDGDEDFHVYSIDVQNRSIKDLTPIRGIVARIEAVSEQFPTEILVGINDREPRQFHDLYRVNLVTGQRQLVLENPGFASLLADDNYQVRFAVSYSPDGGQRIVRRDKSNERGWSAYLQLAPEDAATTRFAGFDPKGEQVYLLDSRNRNTAALAILDLKTDRPQILASDEQSDVVGVMMHPTDKHVEAVTFNYERTVWKVLDPRIQSDMDYLQAVSDGDLQIASRTLDDSAWIVSYTLDDGPERFYYYRREPREAKLLFTSHDALAEQPLVKMHSTVIKARDGLDLVSYYSLPQSADPHATGRPAKPCPLVLDVHGGPWARDVWGFHPLHQLLANRGYAVLSVNFRGSAGFGKRFLNAADGEWAGKMHNDLLDAVEWAVAQGIADRSRVAIMGGSYGGYATLVGMTSSPETFACGVDIVGPSSLETLLQNPPPYWLPMMSMLKRRVGDHETAAGRQRLQARSPLAHAERISKPLLIAQGANDPRAKQSEAEQIVAAMEQRRLPVTYLLYPHEGHGFARPENRFAFYAVAEAFLAEHLGGRYQPVGDAFRRAEFEVPSGREAIPGLQVALSEANRQAQREEDADGDR
jgi:dipeptidyl aminopeptidase/acylaminoacyl peptidase